MDNQVIPGIWRKVMSGLMIVPLSALLLCAYAGTPAHAGRQNAPVSVMDNGRYLIDEDGKPFIVIGACSFIVDQTIVETINKKLLEKGYGKNDWDAIPEIGPGLYRLKDVVRDIEAGRCRYITIDNLDTHLKKLSAAGVNVWRTWVQGLYFGYLEPTVGQYDEVHAKKIDLLLDTAEKHGIRIMLTPWDTFTICRAFDRHPYSTANGGPCSKPNDMLTNRIAIEAEKRLFRYMIDRWGKHKALMGFDIMNEINWALSSTPKQQATWIKEVGGYVKQYETKELGFVHILTCSPNSSRGSNAIYLDKSLNIVNTHFYDLKAISDKPDPWEAAHAVAKVVQYSFSMNPKRPYFDNEHSPFHTNSTDFERMRDTEHCTMWAQFASGAAGIGVRFYMPYTTYQLPEGIEESWSAVKLFAANIDWRTFQSENVASRVEVSEDIFIAACADSRTFFGWLLKRKKGTGGFKMKITGFGGGKREISFYDDTTGKIIQEPRIFEGEEFVGKTPSFDRHIAFIVELVD